MSRWFIAVFALHFIASVLLSTLGLAQPRAQLPQPHAAPMQPDASPRQAVDTASLLDDFDHALMDDQQDLPDILHDSLDPARCMQSRCAQRPGPGPGPDRLSRAVAPPDKPPSTGLA